MPSQKQSKRRRHGAPAVRLQTASMTARRRERRASPRVLLIVGGLVVAAIATAVLVVTFAGGSSAPANVPAVGSLSGAIPGAGDVHRLFAGIPQSGNVLGAPRAPVTMVEYVDLQCPYCREFETVALPQLLSRYVRTGKLRIEQRVLAFIGPDSVNGREAALAAGRQGKQFDLSELLYFNQGTENTGWLDRNMVAAAAASVPGLQVPELLAEAKTGAIQATASEVDSEAKENGVTSTPTILVGHTGTIPRAVDLASPTDTQGVEAAIARALD